LNVDCEAIMPILTLRIVGSFLNLGDSEAKPVKPSFTERPVIKQDDSGSITFEVRMAAEPEADVTWYVFLLISEFRTGDVEFM